MAENVAQSFANHSRFDPVFHFFALPVFVISVIVAIINFAMHPSLLSGWLILVATAAVVVVLKIRMYALRNQDRIIRLEERLRLATLLSEPLRSRIPELTEAQLIGIRFAADAEVPACVERALSGNLSRREIKKSIQNWRPDHSRV
jgi:hypothetical protein